MTSLFDRQTLLHSFLPLSDSGRSFLEVVLVHPDTQKPTGRGFFNDPDFLMEAGSPFAGHFNFALSNFAYLHEQIPSASALNRFDRSSLLNERHQDKAQAHSLSLIWLFKPDFMHGLEARMGQPDHTLQIGYVIGRILDRLQIKHYGLDYFQAGMTLRILGEFLQKPGLGKRELQAATRKLIRRIQQEMQEDEKANFALQSAVGDALWDPLPGMPGNFTQGGHDSIIVHSTGNLQFSESPVLTELFHPGAVAGNGLPSPAHAGPNMLELSQGWQTDGEQYPDATMDLSGKSKPEPAYGNLKAAAQESDLARQLRLKALAAWAWPVHSSELGKRHASRCGSLLLLECDPFSAGLGVQFLLQSAEAGAKAGWGQMLLFSKKINAADLALYALSRHLKGNPLASVKGADPDYEALAREYQSLFRHAPMAPSCARDEGLRHIIRYLEHDYLIKQKNLGGELPPLVIVLDNLPEFASDQELETFKDLCQLKSKLVEVNACLWLLNARPPGLSPSLVYTLCDDRISLYAGPARNGSHSHGLPDSGWQEWEKGFRIEPSLQKLLPELSLVRLRLESHGQHREGWAHYLYHRPTRFFREIAA